MRRAGGAGASLRIVPHPPRQHDVPHPGLFLAEDKNSPGSATVRLHSLFDFWAKMPVGRGRGLVCGSGGPTPQIFCKRLAGCGLLLLFFFFGLG